MINDYFSSPVYFDVDGKPRRNGVTLNKIECIDPHEQRIRNLESEIRSLKFEIECLKADVDFMKRVNLFKQNGLDYCFVDVEVENEKI